jgi:3-hydroxyacyl-[acyl-carrier-protein] dehydratase
MFAGHFPGNPIVPGAYLLAVVERKANDWMRAQGAPTRVGGVSSVKFTRPLRPEETCEIAFAAPTDASLRFRLRVGDTQCAAGTLTLRPAGEADD